MASTAAANNGPGVEIHEASFYAYGTPYGNTIGGPDDSYRNWIEFNQGDGVRIDGLNAHATLVTSNTIASNSLAGVAIENLASGNTVGGSVLAAGNIGATPGNWILNNGHQGVLIQGNSDHNAVWGNLIDGNGTAGSGFFGVEIADSHHNSIGGAALSGSLYGNQITNNGLAASTTSGGVLIQDSTSHTYGNSVAGNYIGVGTDGQTAAGNNGAGVKIDDAGFNPEPPPSGNTIGGPDDSYRNWIEYNTGDGVVITGANAQANLVASNTIDSNSMSGVRIDNGAHDNSIGGSVSGSSGIGLAPGNEIDSNLQRGVYITGGSHNNAVWGNRIDSNGTAGTGFFGVQVENSALNSIGDSLVSPVYGNQITRNGSTNGTDGGGVWINDGQNNLVNGNLIGVSISGSAAGNHGPGVRISSSDHNSIGGVLTDASLTGTAPGNLIEHNDAQGVFLDQQATFNLVWGNLITGNGGFGVQIDDSSDNSIGAAFDPFYPTFFGNIIGGNGQGGVLIQDTDSTADTQRNLVAGNYYRSRRLVAGSQPQLRPRRVNRQRRLQRRGRIGQQYRNWIEYNTGDGVVITGANAQANLVASNTIDSNSMSGVRIDNGAHDNSIGGSVSGSSGIGLAPGNEIDSNLQQGVYITGGSDNNGVWGNRIDANGTARSWLLRSSDRGLSP